MSARSSTSWLIGGLLLVTGLGLVGTLLALQPCRSCDGLALYLHRISSPSIPPRPPPRINCPDCADRGKVSLFRSWIRPRVSEPVAGILRSMSAGQAAMVVVQLNQLVQDDGKDPDAFLAGSSLLMDRRFLEAEGKIYLVLLLQAFNRLPDNSARTAVLLTEDGRALDRVLVGTDGHNASISVGFLEQAPVDGPQIAFGWKVARWPDAVKSCHVDQWQRPARELLSGNPDDPLIQLAIRGDRFEVLTPEVRR